MKKNNINKMINILRTTYPDAKCSLNFENAFQLVVAVCLSAQCTDERVNLTTPALFAKYKTIEDFANCDLEDLEELIHPCGFYKNKAKNIKATSKILIEKYNSQVPQTMEELMRFTWCW